MALITCSECQREISAKASTCPHCGAPIKAGPTASPETKARRRTSPVAWVALGILIAIGAAFLLYSGQSRTFREAGLPPMPVEVAYRESLVGRGRVIVMKNTSERQLSVLAAFQNPTTKQQKTYRVDLAPKATKE